VTRPRASALALLAAAVLAATALVLALGAERPRTLQQRADAVAESLACPVCQNLSVADSTSRVAGEMRRSIVAQLRRGRSPDQIRARFVAAYGDWILLSPASRGLGILAWAVPAAAILGGAAIAAGAIQRWTVGRETA